MPIYEYECKACGHVFDALQKLSDDPLTDCPDCEQPELRKLLSAPNFRLKGGGWYETDFKDKNQRNLAGDAGKPEKDATDKADKANKSAKSDGKGEKNRKSTDNSSKTAPVSKASSKKSAADD